MLAFLSSLLYAMPKQSCHKGCLPDVDIMNNPALQTDLCQFHASGFPWRYNMLLDVSMYSSGCCSAIRLLMAPAAKLASYLLTVFAGFTMAMPIDANTTIMYGQSWDAHIGNAADRPASDVECLHGSWQLLRPGHSDPSPALTADLLQQACAPTSPRRHLLPAHPLVGICLTLNPKMGTLRCMNAGDRMAFAEMDEP